MGNNPMVGATVAVAVAVAESKKEEGITFGFPSEKFGYLISIQIQAESTSSSRKCE